MIIKGKRINKCLAMFLAFLMVFTSVVSTSFQAEAKASTQTSTIKSYSGDGFEVSVNISSWKGAFNATVNIKNTSEYNGLIN